MAVLTVTSCFRERFPDRPAWQRGWFAFVFLFCCGTTGLIAQGAREYQIKAVFLFNFAQFVEWPASAFPDEQAPFVIGVLGSDPFGDALREAVSGERVNQRSFTVQHYERVEDIAACHVLFISQSESGQLERILPNLKNRPVLTVGETEDFAKRGGMIRLVNENNRIRMRINVESAQSAGLIISSKLLRPAEIVRSLKR